MGILTHTHTKGERCRRTKRIRLSLEIKLYSPSLVLAPFCPGKHTETLKIHLLVISRKSELHKNHPQAYPKRRQALFPCSSTPPEPSPCLALGLEQAPHYSISPGFTGPSPSASPIATAAEDGATEEADAHPA